VAFATADDLLHTVRDPGPGQVVLRLEAGAWPSVDSVSALLKEYADLPEDLTDSACRVELRRLLSTFVAGLAASAEAMVRRHGAVAGRVEQRHLLDRDTQGRPVS
jgi:hypothetical protein